MQQFFRWRRRRAGTRVRLEPKFRRQSCRRLSAAQHFLVDDEEVTALAIGKKSCAKRKAVDLPLNFYLAALAPELCGVKRKARNHPAQTVRGPLQHCCKALGLRGFKRGLGKIGRASCRER